MSMILGTFVWNLAGEACDARQAKRLFPLFASAGILGSVIGNAVTGVVARLLGTDNLLLLYAVLLAVAFYLTASIAREYFRKDKIFKDKTNLWDDLRAGFDFDCLRRSCGSLLISSVFSLSCSLPWHFLLIRLSPLRSPRSRVAGFFGSSTPDNRSYISCFTFPRQSYFTRLALSTPFSLCRSHICFPLQCSPASTA